jgi:hypothetical protein
MLKQSTAYNLMLFMVDSADHISGKTGLTLTITASKDGAAFASISPTVTERGSGWYNLALTTSHTDTIGDLALHATGTGADATDVVLQVRARTVDDVLPTASYTAPLDAAGTRSAVGLASANIDTQFSNIPANVRTNLATELGRIDVAVSTRSAPATAQTISSNSDITAIKAKTDSLSFTVSGQVDANIQYVNDVQVAGNGQSGSEWGPA